jgi:NAD(P)-dependent dehydrogenase (short-subunit alcohol dehydrogenase family)
MSAVPVPGGLEGRVALVTGAGRGIGREVAIGLAALGAHVAIVARTAAQLEETGQVISDAGGTVVAIPADVADPAAVRALVDQVASQWGRVDLLINNAAVVWPLGATPSLAASDVEAAFAINVTAVVILSGLVVPGMVQNGWGRIVNVSSGIAEHPEGMVGATVYAASKAALEAHTINLAAELDRTGVTVNAYRPGAVDTAMQAWIRDQPPEEIGRGLHDRFISMQASGTLLSARESAERLLARLNGNGESGQIWSASD